MFFSYRYSVLHHISSNIQSAYQLDSVNFSMFLMYSSSYCCFAKIGKAMDWTPSKMHATSLCECSTWRSTVSVLEFLLHKFVVFFRSWIPCLVIVSWHLHNLSVIWPIYFYEWGLFDLRLACTRKEILFSRVACSENLFNNQMAIAMLQEIPFFFHKKTKKNFFRKSNSNTVSIKNSRFNHDDKTCFLSKCRYHKLITGDIDSSPEKLDSVCLTHKHVDCPDLLVKHRFFNKIVVKSIRLFNTELEAVYSNQWRRIGQKSWHLKIEILSEYYKTHKKEFTSNHKTNGNSWILCRKNWTSREEETRTDCNNICTLSFRWILVQVIVN